MAKLLPLPDDGVSLELMPSEIPLLVAVIERHFGPLEIRPHIGTYAEYRFGGCNFTFQNDWDDPCLISGSNEGTELLAQLHAHLLGSS